MQIADHAQRERDAWIGDCSMYYLACEVRAASGVNGKLDLATS